MLPPPESVQLLHEGHHQLGIICQDSRFPIPAVVVFGPNPGPGQIRAAEVGEAAINDHRLGVETGTQDPFEQLRMQQVRVFVKIIPESWSRLLGMHQPDINPLPHQIRENGKERHKTLPPGDVEILQIRRGDPEKRLRLRHLLHDEPGVMLTVQDQLGHGKTNVITQDRSLDSRMNCG